MKISKSREYALSAEGIKITGIKQIHRGEYLSYYEVYYTDLSGKKQTYEMVSKNHELTIETIGAKSTAVIILTFSPRKDKILLCKEYRPAVNGYVWSLVAGELEDGETPSEAASRELEEETGLQVSNILHILNPTFTCAPVTDDITTLIICEATGSILGSDSPKEEIHTDWYTRDQVKELIHSEEAMFAGRAQAICYAWIHGGNFIERDYFREKHL